ncbi:MAG: phosphohistidine phosphatase SixA [Gammaproteobacteria bacterium]
MKIYLVQHGQAAAKDIDPERPLTDAGSAEVTRMAHFLADASPGIQRILHSGKLRAGQTADIFAKTLSIEGNVEVITGISPNDSIAEFVPVMAGWRTDTLVVGHLPFMARLTSHLLTGDVDIAVVDYQPGTIVCLQQTDNNHWLMVSMVRPDLLGQ